MEWKTLGKYKAYMAGFLVGLTSLMSGASPSEQTIVAFLAMIFVRAGEIRDELRY